MKICPSAALSSAIVLTLCWPTSILAMSTGPTPRPTPPPVIWDNDDDRFFTRSPTISPTADPTISPTASPTTRSPTVSPTQSPTADPTISPTTASPTTASPTTASPTTASPTTASPTTASPTTASPTTRSPTVSPTQSPTADPTISPTASPTRSPTSKPTYSPPKMPTRPPTASPTSHPTISPKQCAAGKALLRVQVTTDANGAAENKFIVKKRNFITKKYNSKVWEKDGFENSSTKVYQKCLSVFGCYKLFMMDSSNDGMCCNAGDGGFKVTWDGNVITDTLSDSSFDNGNKKTSRKFGGFC